MSPLPRFLIFDIDAKYGTEVPAAIRSMKIKSIRTSFESPWQNGVAERWVQSCRRDLLNHVIPLNDRHLMRLLSDYPHHCSVVQEQGSSILTYTCLACVGVPCTRESSPPVVPSRSSL